MFLNRPLVSNVLVRIRYAIYPPITKISQIRFLQVLVKVVCHKTRPNKVYGKNVFWCDKKLTIDYTGHKNWTN